jgi:hypothetical protein
MHSWRAHPTLHVLQLLVVVVQARILHPLLTLVVEALALWVVQLEEVVVVVVVAQHLQDQLWLQQLQLPWHWEEVQVVVQQLPKRLQLPWLRIPFIWLNRVVDPLKCVFSLSRLRYQVVPCQAVSHNVCLQRMAHRRVLLQLHTRSFPSVKVSWQKQPWLVPSRLAALPLQQQPWLHSHRPQLSWPHSCRIWTLLRSLLLPHNLVSRQVQIAL